MGKFEVPRGWTARAYRFALDPSPAQPRAFRSNAGGARKACNTMLALVKAVMDQRKEEAAPWWAENSKESYNSGLDALARGLDAWDKSGKGKRAGATVGFPPFKAARSRRYRLFLIP